MTYPCSSKLSRTQAASSQSSPAAEGSRKSETEPGRRKGVLSVFNALLPPPQWQTPTSVPAEASAPAPAIWLIVSVRKCGQTLAESEFLLGSKDDAGATKTARKALLRLTEEHPHVPLFDPDVHICFRVA